MVVVMQAGATEHQVESVIAKLSEFGFDVHRSSGVNQVVLGAIGVCTEFDTGHIKVLDGVANVHRVSEPYKFASRSWRSDNSVYDVDGIAIGGDRVVVMAGPCSVESEQQIEQTAEFVAKQGATFLRGGAFRPRLSPYTFQGLGEQGLQMLRSSADRHGLKVITEVTEIGHIENVVAVADIIQVGARNMQHFALLKELGQTKRPIFLKRGLSATIEEWLMSAEYIMSHGNPEVILCERGIRTFEPWTRYTLDLSAVPVVKSRSHLPVFVDPSHSLGLRNKVIPMARAAVAAGADGLIVEVHPDPERALSDGPQSLFFDQFQTLMQQVRLIASAIGRDLVVARQASA
jgi:3-deoxy-7-phosphoheptulonate synthase